MRSKPFNYVLIIFVLVLIIRLFLAFQADGFSSDSAYFNLRQVEHIKDNFVPGYNDELSYGGRQFVFLPVFHYILSFFALFLPLSLAGKILPNVFASLLVIIVYLITKEISKNDYASLFSAFVSGFIPVFFTETLNKVSVYSLAVPGIFLSLLFLMKANDDKKYIIHFIVSIFILSFIHSSSFIIIFALALYILILRVQRIKIPVYILELVLFSAFFMLWLQFLLFKEAFLDHGIFLLWQNIPYTILNHYFTSIPLFSALVSIGFIPFLFGLYMAYTHSFETKENNIHLLIGFGLGVFLLLWLKLIELELGLIFLGILLTIGFGIAFNTLMGYIEQTKFPFIKNYVAVFIAFLVVLTSIVPSYVAAKDSLALSPTDTEMDALNWLNVNTPEDAKILSTLEEGHLITGIAERKNFMDSNFLFIDDIDQRYSDLEVMYTSFYTTNVVELLNKYGVDYIYFSLKAKNDYDVQTLNYLSKECFKKVYGGKYGEDVLIYKSLCKIEEE